MSQYAFPACAAGVGGAVIWNPQRAFFSYAEPDTQMEEPIAECVLITLHVRLRLNNEQN